MDYGEKILNVAIERLENMSKEEYLAVYAKYKAEQELNSYKENDMEQKVKKYTTTVEAVCFNGQNFKECEKFIGEQFDNTKNYPNLVNKFGICIPVNVGDYVVKDHSGYVHRYTEQDFLETFDEVKVNEVK